MLQCHRVLNVCLTLTAAFTPNMNLETSPLYAIFTEQTFLLQNERYAVMKPFIQLLVGYIKTVHLD